VIFVESRAFTTRVHSLMDDEQYSKLEAHLKENPQSGPVIPGCDGIRKLRWGSRSQGKGRRSGARVIYLHIPEADRIDMLLVYGKGESEDLTAGEKKVLAELAVKAKKEALRWARSQGSGT
jgi:mRNA-degrading endonuclease RelE of RelBE toxin-antitoxin system